jgi:hypothetical protein
MSRFKLPLLLLFLICWQSPELLAQAARSPFSAFGYGDYIGESLVNNQGMAGVGVSNPQLWYLNNQNPALLVYNRLAVFHAGALLESKRIYSDTIKGKTRNGNINYLALGFPLLRSKKTGAVVWSSGIGLMPYSNVNYSYQTTDTIPGTSTPVYYSDRAEGGFDQFQWANGFRIIENLSVGIKTSFMFSSIASEYSNLVDDSLQSVKYIVSVRESQSLRGVKFTPGIAYRIDSIKNKYSFSFGSTFEIGTSISGKTEQLLLRKDASGNILQADTIPGFNNNVRFPSRITTGISFGRLDKWMVAADYAIISFNGKTSQIGSDITPVQDGWRLAVGGELTPDARSLSSYLKRVTYRAGFSSEQGTYLVNGHAVKDFGINFGFSLPVNRISSLDIAFRSGKRGDEKLNGIEENYFRIYFGVTFNDQWFIKRRFD